MKTMLIVNWCGHGQEFLPEADRYWRLVPVLLERKCGINPNYHASTDTIETLDLGFMEKVARTVTATAIRLCARP